MPHFLKTADRATEIVMTACERHFGLVAVSAWSVALAAIITIASR